MLRVTIRIPRKEMMLEKNRKVGFSRDLQKVFRADSGHFDLSQDLEL